jgi:hypothetical protein
MNIKHSQPSIIIKQFQAAGRDLAGLSHSTKIICAATLSLLVPIGGVAAYLLTAPLTLASSVTPTMQQEARTLTPLEIQRRAAKHPTHIGAFIVSPYYTLSPEKKPAVLKDRNIDVLDMRHALAIVEQNRKEFDAEYNKCAWLQPTCQKPFAALNDFVATLQPLNPEQKAVAIRYAGNAIFAYDQRQVINSSKKLSLKDSVLQGKAVCQQYMELASALSEKVGLRSTMVAGWTFNGKTYGGHAITIIDTGKQNVVLEISGREQTTEPMILQKLEAAAWRKSLVVNEYAYTNIVNNTLTRLNNARTDIFIPTYVINKNGAQHSAARIDGEANSKFKTFFGPLLPNANLNVPNVLFHGDRHVTLPLNTLLAIQDLHNLHLPQTPAKPAPAQFQAAPRGVM